MASNHELSNLINNSQYAPEKQKPPNIPLLSPTPPLSQSSITLSYTDATQKTPTQATGKRKHVDGNNTPRRPAPSQAFITPPKNARSPPSPSPSSRPEIAPLAFSRDSDHVMNDPFQSVSPFNAQGQILDWSDDNHFYTRLSKVQGLLKELHTELDHARNEQTLTRITEDEDIEELLIGLSAILPSFTTNSAITPVMTNISNIQDALGLISDRLQKLESNKTPTTHNKDLSGSVHAPSSYASLVVHHPPSYPQPTPPSRHTPPPKQNLPQPSAKDKKIPINPNSSHHPSRLVAQFPPGGVPENMRPDPSRIVLEMNAALSANAPSSHMKVVAANFNPQGNLIISTRSDQTAAELLQSSSTITPILTRLCNKEVALHEDKKWFKIQIDGVNTSAISLTNKRISLSADAVHAELTACNPQYARLSDSLISKPKWLRAHEELLTTSKSSLVFATTDESAARSILNQRSLAAYGRHCSVRAFQDRPPLTQCRNCWRFDHSSNNCKEQQRCRLCSGLHDEASHPFTDPTSCQRCTIANENGDFMDTADEGRCPHDLRCLNCLGKNNEHNHPADARRCPARIERYGTARDNERRAQKASNPWSSVKPKKPKTKAPTSTLPPNPAPALPSPNRFDALALEPTFPNPLPDANALINFES